MDEEAIGRGRVRDRVVLQTLFGGAGVQIATVLAALISLPVVTRSLTAAEYGVLATLSGFIALLAFADLGIGSALSTRMAQTLGAGDEHAARSATSTALLASIGAAAAVALLGIVAAFVLPWRSILGAEALPDSTVTSAVLVTAIATAFSIPAALGQRALYGLHRGPVANRWVVAGTLLTAAASIVAAWADAPLTVFVLAALGTPAAIGLCCTAWVLSSDPRVRPALSAVTAHEWHVLRATSGWYFLIAVAAAFGFQTDAMIIAGILGAPSAGVYGVAARVFGLVTQSMYPALLQLWSAFADAHARSDSQWVRTRLARGTVIVGVLSGAACLILVLVGGDLIRVWLTPDLVPSRGLLLAMAAWTTFSLVQAPMFLLFNGVGRVRAHALMATAVATLNLPLSLWLATSIGVAGPVLASLLASTVVAAGPGLVVLRRVLSENSPLAELPPEAAPPPVW